MSATGALTREKIFEIARSLPPAPKVLAGLGELLLDVNVDLEPVADLIKRDTALAAHLIRISNSVAYGGSGEIKVGTVEDAVSRVGFREVYRLVGVVTTGRLVERPLKFYSVPTEPLRVNMLYTALVCEALAEAAGLDSRKAYSAGLMRPLGILVLDRVAELLTSVEPYNHETHGSYAAWEGRTFVFSNCDVAAMILAEWGFPTEIVEAVRDHYLMREADYKNRLACLLNLAGGIVAVAGYALPGEYGYWESTPRKLATLNLNIRQINQASDRARAAFDAFRVHIGSEAPAKSCNSEEPSGVLSTNDATPVPTETAEVTSPDEFTTFMRSYQNMVYTTAARLLGNETQAEDIAQEVFIKAYERWDDLRDSPAAGGWLKTVATNMSLNHLQRYRKRWRFFSEIKRPDDDGGEDQPEIEFAAPDQFFAGLDQTERRTWIEQALEALPEHQRVPLILYHFDDLPYEEIAAKLGVSLAKVKTDILRGRAALARLLARGAGREQLAH
ncbi:MAG TPA: sigma-70 family RNA polymerase sigma factor [Opitutaceae bacterium]|nr:sigma-70 family RNA polymerase sigma factor [Opitutaceae bacterium]